MKHTKSNPLSTIRTVTFVGRFLSYTGRVSGSYLHNIYFLTFNVGERDDASLGQCNVEDCTTKINLDYALSGGLFFINYFVEIFIKIYNVA